ncbi:MAG: hypothetical protein B7X55_10405, partial [Rhodobacterales bacterium 34-62-10]
MDAGLHLRIAALSLAAEGRQKGFAMASDSIAAQMARDFVLTHTGLNEGMAARFRRIMSVIRNADELSQE